MRSFRDVSIRWKLLLVGMLTSGVPLLVASAAFVAYELATSRQTMVADLSTLTEIVATNTTAAVTFGDRAAAEATLGALSARPSIVGAGIYTTGGDLFATYTPGDAPARLATPSLQDDGYRFERGYLVLFHPVVLGNERIGTVYLQSDLEELYTRLARYIGIAALFLVAALLIAFVLAFRMQRVIAEPIDHLAQTARLVSRDRNYSVRAVKHGDDELGVLTDSFNEMLSQVHERDVALQAAHADLEERVEERTRDLRREITDRQRAVEALRASEQRYRSVTQSANDAIILADSLGTIVFWNPRAQAMFGYPEEEIVGQPLTAIMPTRFREAHVRGLGRYTTTGEAHVIGRTVELAGLRRDGAEFPIELSLTTFKVGEERFYTGLIRDISERKQAERAIHEREEQLRVSQKMEAVGQLAAGIAHDFNNLLTAINGYSQWLLTRLEPDHAIRGEIEQIKIAGDRAATLTRQLLAFGRRQILSPVVLNVNVVVAHMGQLLRRLIGEDIELITLLDPKLGAVQADRNQLEQVVMNLAVNARDAMPHGGRLTMETANVELDESYTRAHVTSKPGPYVMLAVSDTGCGMDAETRARIFEPFFTTKPQGKGTGLGLSTVYGIVAQSGGHIGVYSEVGHGSSFKVYLPRVAAPSERFVPPAQPARAARGSETILLVEDEELVRKFARDVLRRSGYTVLEARHGGEALAVCERYAGPIHLLLTDIVMPEIPGHALALRLQPARPDMKVIFMSGYTDGAVVQEGTLATGAGFLQKPFTPDTLMQMVRGALDTSTPSDAI